MNAGIPLFLGAVISFVTLNLAEDCQLKDDFDFSAIDVEAKYQLQSDPENHWMILNGSSTLNNCDLDDKKWRCNFDVENCCESEYNYKLEPINVSAGRHLEQFYEDFWWQTPKHCRPYYGPWAYHQTTQGKNKGKVWKQQKNPVFKLIKHNAPERICPGRIPLYLYTEASKLNDNVLSTIEQQGAPRQGLPFCDQSQIH